MTEEMDAEAIKKQKKDAENAALMADVEQWFHGKEFTADWVTRKVLRWHRFLHALRGKPVDVLEIGAFEGRNAVFLLNYLPLAHLTCIDYFKGALDARFDANLAPLGARLTKLKGSAISHLDALAGQGAKFDLIYLDAGKQRDHVLAASLVAWPLLKPQGYFIWDDYDWGLDRPVDQRPHDGIDVFLKLHEADYKLLWNRGQVFVRRSIVEQTPVARHNPMNPDLAY